MSHEALRSCIDACNECALECEHCANACLHENDVKMLARCIALDLDCAELCRTAVILMSRDSEHAADFCQLCADACDACAAECEKHTHMDHCRRCAEACRRCAEVCRRMGSAGGRGRESGQGRELAAH